MELHVFPPASVSCSSKCVGIGKYVVVARVSQHRNTLASSREPPQAIYDAMKYFFFLFMLKGLMRIDSDADRTGQVSF